MEGLSIILYTKTVLCHGYGKVLYNVYTKFGRYPIALTDRPAVSLGLYLCGFLTYSSLTLFLYTFYYLTIFTRVCLPPFPLILSIMHEYTVCCCMMSYHENLYNYMNIIKKKKKKKNSLKSFICKCARMYVMIFSSLLGLNYNDYDNYVCM